MNKNRKKHLVASLIGTCFVLLASTIIFFQPPSFISWIDALENWVYDFGIRKYHKKFDASTPIAIVDIDDASLEEIGRWPWSRKDIATLVEKLHKLGATVLAFDILFSEPEKNIAEEVLKATSSTHLPSAEEIKSTFDYDTLLAQKLQLGESVLAIAFSKDPNLKSAGVLPPPLLTLSEEEANELDIPIMKSYLSNIEILQKAAKHGAFINATPDEDGVLRYSPLLMRYGRDIYPSLAIKATSLYLLGQEAKLQITQYKNKKVLEGIQLDHTYIPTDPLGRVLIPFRGPAYTFPYISAKDVLKDKVKKEQIATKIIFIGSSATATGDLKAAAISPLFFGVEVHATIAAGILDHYLPYKPLSGKGATLLLTIILGLICAFTMPRLGAISTATMAATCVFFLLVLNQLLLRNYGLLLSIFPPIITVVVLYLFDAMFGYVMETRKKEELKLVFGQYVPPSYIDRMMEKGESLSLQGETKELSVLFADIQNFTAISEPLSANELKTFLNEVFTSMTQIIFDHQGTIDKYVGDMIMAFWGAPIDNPQHAKNAVTTALKMQKELATQSYPNLKESSKIHIRIGINTGIMNVGDMGSKFRRAYTVLGDAVNFASRLESICKYYHIYILVGEKTWEMTKEDFIYRHIDKVKVKGKSVAVSIYQPICPKEEATPEILNLVEAHQRAFQKYQEQKWDEAIKLFSELKKTDPENDALYQVYMSRIESFKTMPPPAGWDGAYIFLEK